MVDTDTAVMTPRGGSGVAAPRAGSSVSKTEPVVLSGFANFVAANAQPMRWRDLGWVHRAKPGERPPKLSAEDRKKQASENGGLSDRGTWNVHLAVFTGLCVVGTVALLIAWTISVVGWICHLCSSHTLRLAAGLVIGLLGCWAAAHFGHVHVHVWRS